MGLPERQVIPVLDHLLRTLDGALPLSCVRVYCVGPYLFSRFTTYVTCCTGAYRGCPPDVRACRSQGRQQFWAACVRGFVGGIGAKFRPYIGLIGLAERPSSLPVLVWFVRTLDALSPSESFHARVQQIGLLRAYAPYLKEGSSLGGVAASLGLTASLAGS